MSMPVLPLFYSSVMCQNQFDMEYRVIGESDRSKMHSTVENLVNLHIARPKEPCAQTCIRNLFLVSIRYWKWGTIDTISTKLTDRSNYSFRANIHVNFLVCMKMNHILKVKVSYPIKLQVILSTLHRLKKKIQGHVVAFILGKLRFNLAHR